MKRNTRLYSLYKRSRTATGPAKWIRIRPAAYTKGQAVTVFQNQLLCNALGTLENAYEYRIRPIPTPPIPKYGIKASTIRYWQAQARDLWRYNGIVAGSKYFGRTVVDGYTARELGHAAIQLATVLRSDQVLAVLHGQVPDLTHGGRQQGKRPVY